MYDKRMSVHVPEGADELIMTAAGQHSHNWQKGKVCSPEPGPNYPYKRWNKYWVSREVFEAYAKREAARKRASDAGWPRERVDEFMEMEKQARDATKLLKQRERKTRLEFDRLRLKHGLSLKANRQQLQKAWERTGDPEILAFLHLQSTLTMGDKERIDRIRKLFLSGAQPYDILYQTAIIVGVDIGRK